MRCGRRAGGWYFDGNTTSETYREVLRGISEGDPEVLDALPFLDLSGRWADGLTDAAVLRECGYRDVCGMLERGDGCADEVEWFREGYDLAVEVEVVRVARFHTDGGEVKP